MTKTITTVGTPSGAKLINLETRDLERIVYRTFSRSRFEDLLASNNNGLVHPTKWEDPFENFLLTRTIVREANGSAISLQNLAEDWYGQCWTFNEESDALWRIYSAQNDGIKVAVRLGDLLDDLAQSVTHPSLQAFAGRVLYWTENEIRNHMATLDFGNLAIGGQNDRFAELMCIKREAFAHEAEVRLLFCDLETKTGLNGVRPFPFHPNTRLRGVVVDPRLSQQDAETMMKDLTKGGLTVKIERSTLYDAPSFTIPLGWGG